MPLAWGSNSKPKKSGIPGRTGKSTFPVSKSRALATQQQQREHDVPRTTAESDASLSRSMVVVPPKDPFDTRGQLSRTPLKPVSGASHQQLSNNKNRSGGDGAGRARSPSPATKIPRASQGVRSASPSCEPGSRERMWSTPSRTTAEQQRHVSQESQNKTAVSCSKKGKTAKKSETAAVSTPSRSKVQPAPEDLAAFARTPKISRTPPRSAAAPVPRRAADLFAMGDDQSSAFGTVGTNPASPATVGAKFDYPERPKSPLQSPMTSQSVSELKSSSDDPAVAMVSNIRLAQQGLPLVGSVGTAVAQRPVVVPVAGEPPSAIVFGRSNKVARTPPRTDRKPLPISQPSRPIVSKKEARQDIARDGEIGAMDEAGVQDGNISYAGGAPTPSQKTHSISDAGGSKSTAAQWPAGQASDSRDAGGERDAGLSQHRLVLAAKPSAAVTIPTVVRRVASSASRGRTVDRDVPSSRPPAGSRYISPVPRAVGTSGSVTMRGNSPGEDVGLGSGYRRGTLTPAAFKGLASGMRTPSTEMKRAGVVVDKVQPMRSFETSSSKRPSADAQTEASTTLESSRVPPRAGTFRSSKSGMSSVAEAVAAAATAAARRTAAAVAAKAVPAETHDDGTARSDELAEAEPRRSSSVESLPATKLVLKPVVSGLEEKSLRSVLESVSGDIAVADRADEETNCRRSLVPPFGCERIAAVGGDVLLARQDAVLGDGKEPTIESAAHVTASHDPRVPEPMSSNTSLEAISTTNRDDGGAYDAEQELSEKAEEREPNVADPLVGSNRLARTPPKTTQTAKSSSSTSAIDLSVGDSGVDEEKFDERISGDGMVDATFGSRADDEIVAEKARARGSDNTESSKNPFASRSKLPRTPLEQKATASSVVDGAVGETLVANTLLEVLSDGDVKGGKKSKNLLEAQLEIGELHREVACMADRLAKQTDERNRLAEVAFEAQDEAAGLRQKLEQFQKRSSYTTSHTASPHTTGGTSTNDTAGDGNDTLSASNKGVCGNERGVGGLEARGSPAVIVTVADVRVMELEVEKWECEKEKEEVEKKVKETEVQLEEVQATMRELAVREEAKNLEVLDERYRSAQAKCADDEKRMDERKIKMQLLIADARAQMLRDRVLKEEEERAEQALRNGAAALASRAAVLLKASCARNRRMSERVAGLREGVAECEQRVLILSERSQTLEQEGRAAKHEVVAVMEDLHEARKALVTGRAGAEALSDRLEKSEQECRETHKAHDELRAMVAEEETRRMSLERRLSVVKHTSETSITVERARRLSTERRLGLAEQTRDELASAAATAAGPALRAAADAERARRESVERRLNLAERSSAAVEAERARRLSVERRLGLAEREKAELSATAAAASASAASAASIVAAAAAASQAAAKTTGEDRGAVRGGSLAETGVGPSSGKKKRVAKKGRKISQIVEGSSSDGGVCVATAPEEAGADSNDEMLPGGNAAPVSKEDVSADSTEGNKEPRKEKGSAVVASVRGEDVELDKKSKKQKKRRVSVKAKVKSATMDTTTMDTSEAGDGGKDAGRPHSPLAASPSDRPPKRSRRVTKAVDYRDDVNFDGDERSPVKEAASDRVGDRRAAVEKNAAASAPTMAAAIEKGHQPVPAFSNGAKGTGEATPETNNAARAEENIVEGDKPRRSLARPSYVETDDSPFPLRSAKAAAAGTRKRRVTSAVSSPSSDDDLASSSEEGSGVPSHGGRKRLVKTSATAKNGKKKQKVREEEGEEEEAQAGTAAASKKRAKGPVTLAKQPDKKKVKKQPPPLPGSPPPPAEQDAAPLSPAISCPPNSVHRQKKDISPHEVAGKSSAIPGARKKEATAAAEVGLPTTRPRAPAKKNSKKQPAAVADAGNDAVVSNDAGLRNKKQKRRGSGVGPASGRAKRRAQAVAAAPEGSEGLLRDGGRESAEAEILIEDGSNEDESGSRRSKSTIKTLTVQERSSKVLAQTTLDEEEPPQDDEAAAPNDPVSPVVAHPAAKRSRKLLRAGAARCRTPKVKAKATTVSNGGSAYSTAAANGTVEKASATVSNGISSRPAAIGIPKRGLVGKVAGGSAGARAWAGAAASFRTSIGSAATSVGGGNGGGRPILRVNTTAGNTVLGMRGKSKSGVRGSFFQAFLNPKNGFTVPKLKSSIDKR